MGAIVVALGFAVLFQFILLRVKWNKGMYADASVDVLMLLILNVVFGGTILGVVSATAGSTLISLYLMWKPIRLPDMANTTEGSSSEEKFKKSYSAWADKIDNFFD